MTQKNHGRKRWSVAAGALAAVFAATNGLAHVEAHSEAQTLPPTQPTSLPGNTAMPAPIAGTPVYRGQVAHRPHPAVVTYLNGQIDVRASDSSLNQILRTIARATGLKITGGVQEERVFGNYGPAPMATVLATLLGGTGTNFLFLGGDEETPPKLVLTPRGGGATPPGPDSLTYAAYDGPQAAGGSTGAVQGGAQNDAGQAAQSGAGQAARSGLRSGPASVGQPLNNVNGSPANSSPTASTLPTTHSVPLDSVPSPSTTPSTSGIVDAPNPPAPGSTTGTSPNGTLTPEQVYQQLLKQQQAKPPDNGIPPQR